MKRVNHLHEQVCTQENIWVADYNARKNKNSHYGVQKHDTNKDKENEYLLDQLVNLTYQTSSYSTFKIYEPKERLIFRLPYYPDRITHHAIMNVLEPIWVKTFIKQTYSCIKDRGISKAARDVQNALRKHRKQTQYCLKLDVRKFYPSINHETLKRIIRRKIKDKKLLVILDEIIDSADGVPIGNYLSQFFANLYLSYMDHWLKEEVKCKFYFRYADDIVILHHDKNFLHNVLIAIKFYLKELKLQIKDNYQIFPVEARGVDFIGYKFYHTHTLLRKSLKKRIFKLINKYKKEEITFKDLRIRIQAYFGWLKYCNSKCLLTKIEKLTGLHYSNWIGKQKKITDMYGKTIYIVNIQDYSKYYRIDFMYHHKPYYILTDNSYLYAYLKSITLPVNYTLKCIKRPSIDDLIK